MSIAREKVIIKEACMLWVSQFNAFPVSIVQKLFCLHSEDWNEITPILEKTRVFSYKYQNSGVVVKINRDEEGKYKYIVNLDNGEEKESYDNDLSIENDTYFPMWGTMWQFNDVCDKQWITSKENQRIMAECGFRIYESKEFGYFFGIDGAGYDFYKSHWFPLYEKRGLGWHSINK